MGSEGGTILFSVVMSSFERIISVIFTVHPTKNDVWIVFKKVMISPFIVYVFIKRVFFSIHRVEKGVSPYFLGK